MKIKTNVNPFDCSDEKYFRDRKQKQRRDLLAVRQFLAPSSYEKLAD